MIENGLPLLAAEAGTTLVERWRDLGPVLWLVAAAAAVVWAALLGVFAFATRCRDVEPGATTMDLGGPESPAVVNLLTSEWRLGHEAVPATLLDLAARRLVSIEQVGEQTLVRVRSEPAAARHQDRPRQGVEALEPYERMVLDHVTHHATDGVVPAEALTTGPEDEARGWWRTFRRSVEREARQRRLSRWRWSRGAHTVLVVTALVVAALVGLAATTLPDDTDDPDDDPAGAALALGVLTAGGLVLAVEALNGQRDTATGREVASRWLGLRALLADDPLFAEYPPAGVAIWDRLLAYGAAMGVAHGAVRALPLGAERDDEAWSPVGGRWRVVRIRYPRFIPPGYGRHPGLVAALGAFQLGLGVVALPASTAAGDALIDAVSDLSTDDTVPVGLKVGITVGLAVVGAVAALLALRGASMAVGGGVDLASRRRRVEGRALRVRRRGTDEQPRWYVAVDDGSSACIRAWRTSPGGALQGATVAADVTPWLAHVRNLQLLAQAPSQPSLPTDDSGEGDDEETAAAAAGKQASPLSALLGTVQASPNRASNRTYPLPPTSGPPPPLPDEAVVSAAAGRRLRLDGAAGAHPLSREGRSATYTAADGAMVQVAWVDHTLLQAHRSMPRLLRRELPGVGDEAYRAVMGGGVVARQDGHVLVVMGRFPGSDDAERNRALEEVARAALAPSERP